MLPRVSAAIAQFISPIASSRGQDPLVRQKEERPFQRFKQPKNQDQAPAPEPEPNSEPAPVIPLRTTAVATAGSTSVTQAVLQLMAALRQQRLGLLRWLGERTYQAMARGQKKAGRFRKGAILDHKAQ